MRFYIWDAPCAAAVGVGDSIEIAANTASFGVVGPLNRDVDKKVEQNGGLYRGSQVAFTVAREAGITIVTAGAGNVVTAGRAAGYSATTVGVAKAVTTAATVREGVQTVQGAVETGKAISKGDVSGALVNGGTTILSGIGTVQGAKGVAASMKKNPPTGARPDGICFTGETLVIIPDISESTDGSEDSAEDTSSEGSHGFGLGDRPSFFCGCRGFL